LAAKGALDLVPLAGPYQGGRRRRPCWLNSARRNRIELKRLRRFEARFDRLDARFLAFTHLAAAMISMASPDRESLWQSKEFKRMALRAEKPD
jgi:hypothetical protein